MRSILQTLFIVLAIAVIAQAVYVNGQLPERVATHFKFDGRPIGGMSRTAHLAWQIAMVGFVAALFQGILWLQSRLPNRLLSVPHPEYWTAPERRGMLDDIVCKFVLWLGVVLMAYFLGLFHFIYRANRVPGTSLSEAVLVLTFLQLAVIVVLVLGFVFRLRRKPPAAAASNPPRR